MNARPSLPGVRRRPLAPALKVLVSRLKPGNWINPSAQTPAVGAVRFGSLRRLTPVSSEWGFDRGTPIDRFFIESFLTTHAADVQGRVLEVANDRYTRRFGAERVTRSDVLYLVEGNPQATFVGDLANGAGLPDAAFDCVILTQTLQYIYDLRAAVRTLCRILKPGGVLLATMPGLSEVSDDVTGALWHWSFTATSARRVLIEAFAADDIDVSAHGNVLLATAFLHGIAAEELRAEELAHQDPRYVVSVTARAVKR